MKISGFSFIKNASKLYIPIEQSIRSILPLVDEYVIAIGDNEDETTALINSINSPKIKIIDTVWDRETYGKNTVFAQQTDIAKEHCTGDWLFYLQGDEAIHENDFDTIKNGMKKHFNNPKVEGFIFNYYHFWGDYNHYHRSHKWYPKEIRIIRNDPSIHSWKDAQSFRKYHNFSGTFEDYMGTDSEKLSVVQLDAHIYHYGYVRPPQLMNYKAKSVDDFFHGRGVSKEDYSASEFDYGPLNKITTFKGTHPEAMKDWISTFDWGDSLQFTGSYSKSRPLHDHEKLKYRVISWIENNILNGGQLGGFKNYNLI